MGKNQMLAYRIYISLVLGTAVTLLAFLTLNVTWLIGIAVLMPGVTLTGMVYPQASSPVPMVVANVLVYSLVALPFVWSGSKPADNKARHAVATTLISFLVVTTGWLAARKAEQAGVGPCTNDVLSETASPDHRYKAVVFIRDCGATMDYSAQVSIIKYDEKLRNADLGNSFVSDSDHGAVMPSANVQWQSPKSLIINYPGRARTFFTKTKFEDISVKYNAK
ncbi:MAG TPA: hypothetical protein VD837_05925 [Terriglobales bacterium]|nr:hypothetical protein [Terriglobales bacterium]